MDQEFMAQVETKVVAPTESPERGAAAMQLKGVAVTVVYGFSASFVILFLIDKTLGLRVAEDQEREGLDISLHGESVE